MQRRRVRTPLGTLNDYVDTFHRVGQDGKQAGWIEPFCSGAALSGDGVEVLEILQCKQTNPAFHLQLTPAATLVGLDLQPLPIDPDQFDELDILRDMEETFAIWSGSILHNAGIVGINIVSIVKDDQNDIVNDDDIEDDDDSHDILIKLEVHRPPKQSMTCLSQLYHISQFIFRSQLAQKDGLRFQSSLDSGVARWKVTRPGILDLQWNERRGRGKTTLRCLLNAPGKPWEVVDSNLN